MCTSKSSFSKSTLLATLISSGIIISWYLPIGSGNITLMEIPGIEEYLSLCEEYESGYITVPKDAGTYTYTCNRSCIPIGRDLGSMFAEEFSELGYGQLSLLQVKVDGFLSVIWL